MSTEKAREDRARCTLRRCGYQLSKTPARSWLRRYYDVGFQVINDRNCGVLGICQRGYEATLEQVEDFVAELTRAA
jgi:hypothetical protein